MKEWVFSKLLLHMGNLRNLITVDLGAKSKMAIGAPKQSCKKYFDFSLKNVQMEYLIFFNHLKHKHRHTAYFTYSYSFEDNLCFKIRLLYTLYAKNANICSNYLKRFGFSQKNYYGILDTKIMAF